MEIVKDGVLIPAGKYFIGDPCYAVPHSKWSQLLDSCGCFGDPIGKLPKGSVCAFGTKWGDGEYSDGKGGRYPVDSGLIGATPLAVTTRESRKRLATLGRVVTFDKPVLANESRGYITIGEYTIDTAQEGDDEDE